jgi:hypothetical protein
LVKTLVSSPLCLSHRSFCGLLCHLVLLYVVCTLVLVQALVAFLPFLDSLLHIFIPPPSVF